MQADIDISKLAELIGSDMSKYDLDRLLNRRTKLKGNVGQRAAMKLRNRKANKRARKSRRLNIQRGFVHGKQ